MNELASLIRSAIAESLRGVNTGLPGRIVDFDPSSQTATVQPLIRMKQPDGRTESMPVLAGVPVVYPRGGGGAITFPLQSGDGVMVQFSQRSLDEWKEAGGEQTPDDPRMLDMSDAIAVPGLVDRRSGGTESDCLHLFFGGSSIKVYSDRIEVDTPTLIVNGNLTVGGGASGGAVNITSASLSHNGVNVGSTHRHGGIQSGGSNTDVPNA